MTSRITSVTENPDAWVGWAFSKAMPATWSPGAAVAGTSIRHGTSCTWSAGTVRLDTVAVSHVPAFWRGSARLA
jgi:hypothetical protein